MATDEPGAIWHAPTHLLCTRDMQDIFIPKDETPTWCVAGRMNQKEKIKQPWHCSIHKHAFHHMEEELQYIILKGGAVHLVLLELPYYKNAAVLFNLI